MLGVLATSGSWAANAQNRSSDDVMWTPVDVSRRNLLLGPGGASMRPNVRRVSLIRKETGGNNLKYRIRDASGRTWVAKIADESQAETAAVRLLWAVGYRTEINYLVPRMTIPGAGTFRNVRLEARPANINRGDRWGWKNNPFAGTRELSGLKIMMALINNWDLKDGNNIILETGRERQFVVSDLGSSFGKLPGTSVFLFNRFGRSVNKPVDYANSKFIDGLEGGGEINFNFGGKAEDLLGDIPVEHGRWIGSLLAQLTDRQIRDAFRAANYSPSEVTLLSRTVRQRINQLNSVTRFTEARLQYE